MKTKEAKQRELAIDVALEIALECNPAGEEYIALGEYEVYMNKNF